MSYRVHIENAMVRIDTRAAKISMPRDADSEVSAISYFYFTSGLSDRFRSYSSRLSTIIEMPISSNGLVDPQVFQSLQSRIDDDTQTRERIKDIVQELEKHGKSRSVMSFRMDHLTVLQRRSSFPPYPTPMLHLRVNVSKNTTQLAEEEMLS